MGRIRNPGAKEILLSRVAFVLWKLAIPCAFLGLFSHLSYMYSVQSLSLALLPECNRSSVIRNNLRPELVTSRSR